MSPRTWRRIRRGVQISALLLFSLLFVYTSAQRPVSFGADLFSRLDPLLMLSASLAGRTLAAGFLLAGLTVLVTLLFGRVWCGWFCPLGTLLEWLRPRSTARRTPPAELRVVKYLLLFILLFAALLGNQTLIFFDPITILNRTVTAAAWPALRHAVISVETVLYGFEFLWPLLDAVHQAIVQPLFLDVQPVFIIGVLIGLSFVVLVGLNWWAERFWCRYLCPLGALLGLLSKVSLVRRDVGEGCLQCAACVAECPTGTIDPEDGYRSDAAECVVCFDCLTDCPAEDVGFRLQVPGLRPEKRRAYDPSRRQVLAAGGAAVIGVALAGVEPVATRQPATMIRPPGALLTDFSALCIRCGACVRVCPTQGLQPSLFEGGLQNTLTPRLVPRLGFCNHGCNACGQVCPTGAIPSLALDEKQQTVIGLATINRDRCLPWAYNQPCIVCEEVCPIPDKAITLEEVEVVDAAGNAIVLQRPSVVKDLCTGCGTCEYKCPLEGEAAVRVYAAPGV